MSLHENYLDRIVETKRQLRSDIPDLKQRFAKLTHALEQEVGEILEIQARGESPIPQIRADQLEGATDDFKTLIRQRGCVIVRDVFHPERVARWNREIDEYLHENDYLGKRQSRAGLDQYFSELANGKPQIYSVYWSKPQIEARQSQELAGVRRWLNRLWNFESSEGAESKPIFDPDRECTYADRIRQREPGDRTLGLSPHIDGGTIERWIEPSYRQIYRHILRGDISDYRPFDAHYRTEAKEIPSPAVCQMFRTYQGWTALTRQGPGDGTLNLVPIANAMPWVLLRALQDDIAEDDLCGAKAGRALSIKPEFHDLLLRAFLPIPEVQPGDTVWWHPDLIHGVEDVHGGKQYSNVMYIGAAPDCDKNRAFQLRQRQAFEQGKSCPDFAPEDYEVEFKDRATTSELSTLGRIQMGYDAR
ncbi:YbiU family protein [Pokkaliibacter sp. CJK22405]|uniref:YbiU family protein n=1 Tax=Pokkaliibacter sp. CJK22405 TaxID=3384615 RepID=UPI00398524CE